MEETNAKSFMENLVIVSLATIFSCITLWLIDSWIKYPLFFFEIVTIIVLFLIINNYDVKISVKRQIDLKHPPISMIIDLTLILSSLILLIANIFQISIGLIQLILSLLCTSLLSGYALLNILEIRQYFSTLETVILSYVISYILTAFITLAIILLPEDMRILMILSIFIGLGIISILKHKKSDIAYSTRESLAKNIDALAITLVLIFYALSFYFLYPRFALLPGTDISRHYARSIVLWRTPNLYIGSAYLLAHLHESTFIHLSNSSMASIQTALVTLNLMLPLAFYIMARSHLKKIDARLPSLATLFWTLFTNSFGGFAWLYFATLKLSAGGQTQLQLLVTTADKTYNGTIYGILGLWHAPATTALILLMVAIFLISKKDIPTLRYLFIFSILIATLYLTHVTEAVIFALFLAIYGGISRDKSLRINDAMKSTIIGFLLVTAVYCIFSQITPRFIINTSLLISIIGPILALLLSLLFRLYIRPRFSSFQKVFKVNKKSFGKTLVLALFFAYTVTFISWASLVDSFHTWQVNSIGFVPYFMYPLMLGINGLLALLTLYYFVENIEPYRTPTIFIVLMVFAFVTGRIVSIINMNFFNVGYWEKRFIWFIKMSLATLSPFSIITITDKIRGKTQNILGANITSALIIGIVVLYGISTTFLNLEYWNIVVNNPSYLPSLNEMEAIKIFKEILDNDPKTWLVTTTGRSLAVATFAAPADMFGLRQLLYTAYRPEIVFTQFYRHPIYNHPYIYLHNRDIALLNKFSDRFLIKYISMLPLVYENSEVKIYNVSKLSPPQPESNNVLILPFDKSFLDERYLHITYSILSQGSYNYTIAYDLDDKILNSNTLILSYDPPETNILRDTFQDSFDGKSIPYSVIKGNWQIISGELLGGEVGEYGEGIILSPISAENFTASFKAKPISGNVKVLNYISLVYSWIDPKNYRIADVMFDKNGYICVHFRVITNGIERTIPNWPGIKTDLKWNFGSEYNVTVVVNGTLNRIYIDNKLFLSVKLENIPGRIGLRYYRFHQVSFDDFSIVYKISLNLRSVEDYIEFLKLGGRIVILNTNGYNFFGKTLFSLKNDIFKAEKIEGTKTILNLPRQVIMPKLTLKNPTTSILSKYMGSKSEVPFIVKQNYGKGKFFYVNVYPIIKAMYKNESRSEFYNILGELLEDLNLPKINPNTILNFDGYVKEIRLNNGSSIETSSLIFPLKLTIKQLDVRTKNETVTLFDVTGIEIKNYSKLFIETRNLTISDGQGFYATLKFNSTFLVKPSSGLLNLKINTVKERIHITHVEQVSITPYNLIKLLARTPRINASRATFIEFYPSSSLYWRTRTYGQNLHITGLTSFRIPLSDSYTVLKDVKLGDSFTRDPPIVMFDELSTLPTAIFWTLLLLPIFLGTVFIHTSKQSFQKQ